MKEPTARSLYESCCQCLAVRFEERAKEWGPMARLTTYGKPQRKQQARSFGEGRRGFARSHWATTRNQVI